jgi:hypothetical protein
MPLLGDCRPAFAPIVGRRRSGGTTRAPRADDAERRICWIRSTKGATVMADGTGEFGISNLEYDLVTTLSNLLEGQDVLAEYTADAEAAGNQEAAEIFRSIQSNNQDAALRIRTALGRIIAKTPA